MSETFLQVPPDSTGQRLRMRQRTIGGQPVLEQAVFQGDTPTYYVVADNVTFANSKTHISIMNAVGSGLVLLLRKAYAINLQTAAVTGAALRMDARRITAHSGGTALTPVLADTASPALPAQVTVLTNATVTSPTLLYPFIVTTEEETATAAFSKNAFTPFQNLQPEGPLVQPLHLREGQGFAITQITAGAVGSYAWLLVFATEAA
jgi:hypothetical protein